MKDVSPAPLALGQLTLSLARKPLSSIAAGSRFRLKPVHHVARNDPKNRRLQMGWLRDSDAVAALFGELKRAKTRAHSVDLSLGCRRRHGRRGRWARARTRPTRLGQAIGPSVVVLFQSCSSGGQP